MQAAIRAITWREFGTRAEAPARPPDSANRPWNESGAGYRSHGDPTLSRGARDFELMLVRYAPNLKVEFDPESEPLGMGGT